MKKILVVEDNSSVRELMRVLIEGDGYEIQEARDGLEGLLKAEFSLPDLLILDLMMPDVDGERMLAQMKAEPKLSSIPVLVVSGKHEALDRCADIVGAENVFSKPFEPTRLLDRVNQILGGGGDVS